MKFYRSLKPLLFLLMLASAAQGQWKMLKDFHAQIYSVHFLDREGYPQVGFVGLTDGEIWRTSDGGGTWLKSNTRPNLIAPIRDFTFKDSLTGWLCQSQAAGYPAVYITTDAGVTWDPQPINGKGMAIYYNLYSHALTLSQWSNGSVSTDYGLTWTYTGNPSAMCGIAFTDTLHGLQTTYPSGGYSSTTDGGLSWQNLAQAVEAWQPLAIKGTHTFFICAEGARQIQRSNDDGKTWKIVYQFPATLDLTGDIRGDLSAMYVQSKDGMFYSVDQGISWSDYCGPKNDFDSRFYNIGSDTVYAGTLEGQLWFNPYGVKKNNLLLQFPKIFDLTSQGCLNADSLFRFINLSNCLQVKILDMEIVSGLGSKTFSFKTPIFPVVLDSMGDSVKITYTPDNSGADSAQFFVKYSVGGEIFQVFVKLRGFVKPRFNVSLSKDLNVFLEHFCGQIDTFVTIKSGLCGADTLLAVKLSDPTAFSVTPPALPAAIPAGGTLRIPVLAISSLNPGTYTALLTLTIRSGGITRDTIINLTDFILSNSEARTNLTPGIVKFDTVSICEMAMDTIIVKNTLCNTLFIYNIRIQPAAAAAEFSLLHKIIPDTLIPKESDTILVQYKPTVGGPIAGSLVLNIGLEQTDAKDTIIPISGIGKALPSSALGSRLLHFADTVPCSNQELSTYLYNNSCGYDTIVSIIPSQDKSFSVLSPTPPTTVISGDSTLIRIQEDPLSPGAKFDSVRAVIHSSTGAIDTVVLKVSGIVNKPHHLLSMLSLLTLDSLAPCTPIDTTLEIKNLGRCDTLIINSLTLTGPNWFSLGNSAFPAKILPGGSFFYTLHFSPGAKANASGSVHILGVGIDTAIAINANSKIGGSPLTVTGDSIFSSSFCKLASHTFTLQNTSCDSIVFDNLSLKNILGNQFSFTPNILLPLRIQPGGKQDIIITFDPSAIGDSLATFSYRSTISGISRTIGLRGTLNTIKQTAHLELMIALNLKQITTQAGASITVRLLLQDNIDPSLGLQSVKATISYFDNVLSVIGSPIASSGWKLNSVTPGKGTLMLDLLRTDNNGITAGAEIATVQFETFVTDSSFTPLDLQAISLNGGDLVFQSCVLSPQALLPVTVNISECGSKVLSGYINHDNTVFTNIIIRPNPAASGSQINVDLQLNQQSDIYLTLRDAIGRTVAHIKKSSLAKGLQNLQLDLPKDASGFYILSLEAGGMRESRKIVIEE